MTVFGPVVRKHDVEAAVERTLQLWMESYLGQAGRDTDREGEPGSDRPALPAIGSWSRRGEMATWPDNRLPAVVIHCPGLRDSATADEDGIYMARWVVEVGCIVAAETERDTEEIAGIYAAEIRRLLVDHPSLGDFALDTEWFTEDYRRIPDRLEQSRLLGGGVVEFTVTVDGAAQRAAGPQGEPQDSPRDPYPDLPEIESVEVDLDRDDDEIDP